MPPDYGFGESSTISSAKAQAGTSAIRYAVRDDGEAGPVQGSEEMVPGIGFEDIAQGLITALSAREEANFAAGDILVASADSVRLAPLASAIGRSADFLRQLRKVSSVFPPETRAQDHPWSVHRLCAYTPEPDYWLNKAVYSGWSVRQLRQALIAENVIIPRPGNTGTSPVACPRCQYRFRPD